ncbi:DUF6959 family protein [Streptomyces sp. 900105245]
MRRKLRRGLRWERVEAELFTDGSNDAVGCLPGRNFSGVLIQGGTLGTL